MQSTQQLLGSDLRCELLYACLVCTRSRRADVSLLLQPDAFEASHYTLRPAMYNRETELLIGVTMYNVGGHKPRLMRQCGECQMLNKRVFPSTQEDEILLTRTLHGIMSEHTSLIAPPPVQ